MLVDSKVVDYDITINTLLCFDTTFYYKKLAELVTSSRLLLFQIKVKISALCRNRGDLTNPKLEDYVQTLKTRY